MSEGVFIAKNSSLVLLLIHIFTFAACSRGNNNVSGDLMSTYDEYVAVYDNYSESEQARDNYEGEAADNYESYDLTILDAEVSIPYISDFGFSVAEDFFLIIIFKYSHFL